MSKKCYRCKVIKPTSEFSVDSCRKSGLQGYCKQCAHEVRKNYRKTQDGKDARLRHRVKYPEKVIARRILHAMINKGNMPRADTLLCRRCGKQAILYHHYLGYAPEHAIYVVPLCQHCHTFVHHHL